LTTSNPSLTIDRAKAAKLRIGLLCISMDPGARAALEGQVILTPGAHLLDNVDWHIVPREVSRVLDPFQHRVCVIDFDGGLEESCRMAERIRDNCERVTIFAASTNSDPSNIIAAMRSGCAEYLIKPFDAERVSAALEHIEARRHVRDQGMTTGKIVTIMGAKGGMGVTSLATHLALNLVKRHQQKCLVIDQHRAMGDVSLYLGLTRHQYSFYELVHNTDRLDDELLQGFLLQHESGLHILDSPEVLDSFPHASPEAIEHTLAFLAEHYQFIIIDSPPGITDDSAAAIRQSDLLQIVLTPELPAVRSALRWVEYLIGMQYPENCIDIVLNRCAKNSALSDQEVETTLRRAIAVKVPNSYNEIAKAINAGLPVAERRNASLPLAFDAWADRLMGATPESPAKTNGFRGWFGLLG
jgi:pilus assembly protein CpaE